MTEPKKYWLTDGSTYALVTGAEQRDHYLPLGWAETDEPTEGFVMVWHDGIEKPGIAPVAFFDLSLQHNGWVAGPPEGAEHPFAAKPEPEAPAEPVAPAGKAAGKNAAAGGNESRE